MKIFHIFRAPVGGLFRHVADLARLQAEAGHDVGLIADETTGGARAEAQLEKLRPELNLGIHRLPMQRNPHLSDIIALRRINTIIAKTGADIIHGHGSKGGLYARLPGLMSNKGPLRVYTPHGGSLNYHPGTTIHTIYMKVERLLERGTDLLMFESQFVADRYFEYVCQSKKPHQVFFNGLLKDELNQVQHNANAADFMFIGELRPVKGVNILIESIAQLTKKLQRPISLNIYGSGPDEEALKNMTSRLQLNDVIKFHGPAPARSAFESGKTMLMGSTFESMPYVVLEAAGCGQPLISTCVGGIPEIFGSEANALIKPGSVEAMCAAMLESIMHPEHVKSRAERLKLRIADNFSAEGMAATIETAYRRAIQYKSEGL
jgi:glycosyltransferase involved in cell wall biosynthesis